MAIIPFVGGNYIDRSLNVDCQVAQNLFPAIDNLRKVICLYGVPGLTEWWVDEIVVDGTCDVVPTGWGGLGWDVAVVASATVSTPPPTHQCVILIANTTGINVYGTQDLIGLTTGQEYHGSCEIMGYDLIGGDFVMKLGDQIFDTHTYSNGSWVSLEGNIIWDGISTELKIGVDYAPGNISKRLYIDTVSVYHT